MERYKIQLFNRITGELLFEKEYHELFPVDEMTKISRGIKLQHYCKHRLHVNTRDIEVIHEQLKERG